MNEQQLIDFYMVLGKSKAEATRLAQAQLAGGSQARSEEHTSEPPVT